MQRITLRWAKAGVRVGFVPTMGFLHAGHLSLIRRARAFAGKAGKVVLSVYVNPTQFGPQEDFTRYPRDFSRDAKLCRQAGVDVLFVPLGEEMYPEQGTPAGYSTFVVEETLSRTMEGASRPTHFRGVTTVVAKLFNIVRPGVAVFGAKDYQQAAVIQRMTRDLNFPVKIVVARTVRERDGLAMSSRNKYLEGRLRVQARALWEAISAARDLVHRSGSGHSAEKLKRKLTVLIEEAPDARVDYIEFFDPETLEPQKQVRTGVHLALAVLVGKTRLIDNARL
jgi:pantoate--beta-alanine ligase